MSEVVGEAVIRIRTDDSAVKPTASAAGKKAGSDYSKGFGGALKIGASIAGALVVQKAISLGKDAIAEARESQKVNAASVQIIKQTGGAANVTANELGRLTTRISNKVGVDDEAIQSGANLILTFNQVRNEVGKGNDIFDRATKAAVDLSAAGFGSITGASVQLGKALQDPIKGITALARSGVTFSDSQKEQIKTLVAHNNLLGAQKIILKGVEGQVGGVAAATATSGEKFNVAFKNLEESVGTALLPSLDKLEVFLTDKAVPAVDEFVTQLQDGTGAGGQVRDVFEEVVAVGKGVFDLFDSLPGPVKKFGAEGLIAYAAYSRLAPLLTATGQGLSNFATGLASAETRSASLGPAIKNLAGAAGLVALQDGLHRSNEQLGALETTLGGAATGFAIGGPVGAAVGALGGLALAVKHNNDEMNALVHTTDFAKTAANDYANSLDAQTGAYTKNSHAALINSIQKTNPDVLTAANTLGISNDTLARALEGHATAQKKLNAALREGEFSGKQVTLANGGQTIAAQLLTQALYGVHGALAAGHTDQKGLAAEIRETTKEAKEQALTGQQLSAALKGIPTKVATDFLAPGAHETLNQVETLIDKYHRTPKEVRTLVKGLGIKPTRLEMEVLIDRTTKFGQLRPVVTVKANTQPAKDSFFGLLHDLINHTVVVPINTSKQQGRAAGGPVRAGVPYIVGERQPELFVPDVSGTIIPSVPQTQTAQRTTVGAPVAQSIVVNENYYGPTTGRGRLNELQWTLRYATRARN